MMLFPLPEGVRAHSTLSLRGCLEVISVQQLAGHHPTLVFGFSVWVGQSRSGSFCSFCWICDAQEYRSFDPGSVAALYVGMCCTMWMDWKGTVTYVRWSRWTRYNTCNWLWWKAATELKNDDVDRCIYSSHFICLKGMNRGVLSQAMRGVISSYTYLLFTPPENRSHSPNILFSIF